MEVVGELEGHKYTIWALASDGFHLYSGSNDHTIRVPISLLSSFDLSSYLLFSHLLFHSPVYFCEQVWNLEGLACTSILTEHESKIFGLEIKDNLLFSSGDKIVKVRALLLFYFIVSFCEAAVDCLFYRCGIEVLSNLCRLWKVMEGA